jgi:integrase
VSHVQSRPICQTGFMTKRDYGTGSIVEKAANRWEIRWYEPRDLVTGTRRRRGETFIGSKRDATKRLQEVTTLTTTESLVPLADCIRLWRSEAEHELGTIRNYDLAVTSIPKALMGTPISKIRSATINSLVRKVTADHGVHRARLVHAVVSGALTHAWRQEWLADNPAKRVKYPTPPRRPGTQPTPDQVRALLDLVVDNAQLYAWLLTSADSGCRRGEVLALRWSHVRAGELFIEHALDPIDAHEKATKTDNVRTVAISTRTTGALEAWRIGQREFAADHSTRLVADPFVFSDANNGARPWRPDVATKRFGRLRARAGIEGVRLYDIRHYVATELLGAGVDPKTVAGRLGHTRVATTNDLYGHVIPARDRAAADVLDNILNG